MGLRQALGSTRSDLSFVFRKSTGKTTTGCCRVAISSRLQLGHRMRHQRRRKVHLPRLDRLYAVGVEQPFGEQRIGEVHGACPAHRPSHVAVDVAHACRHVAPCEPVEVGLALREYSPQLFVVALCPSLLLRPVRVAVVQSQTCPAVFSVFYSLGVGELASPVRQHYAEQLREPWAAEVLQRVQGFDHAGRGLVREQDVELEAYPAHEKGQHALRVFSQPAHHRIHLDGVLLVHGVESAEIGPPAPFQRRSGNLGRFPAVCGPVSRFVAHGPRKVQLR